MQLTNKKNTTEIKWNLLPIYFVIKKTTETTTAIFEVEVLPETSGFPTNQDRAISATNSKPPLAVDERREVDFTVLEKY